MLPPMTEAETQFSVTRAACVNRRSAKSNDLTMKRLIFLVVPVLLAWPTQAEWQYPPTKTVDASDTYFGKTYKDPYRWLEDMKDKEVEAWFKAQADLTDALLAKIPGRDALAD